MAQACGKLFADWKRSKAAESYLVTLSSVMGIPITELVEVNQGGNPSEQGTWGHPKVGLRFAQWCSDEFAVQVDFWIDELLTTGKVELVQPVPQIEPLKRETQAQLLLALKDVFDFQPDDRTAVTLKAHLTNLIEASQQAESVPQLLSITEVCEMHGIYLPQGKDSVIGRKVAKIWRDLHDGTDPQTCAKHVGTGHRTADIKVYPAEFFERIIAIAQEYLG